MQVMVTGGAGYIGSHCVLGLLKNGQDVVIVDNLSTGHEETVKTLQNQGHGNVRFIKADLREPLEAADVFQKAGDVDSVIHFAAFSQVNESVKDPAKYLLNNIFGTVNLLNEMVKHNIGKIIFSSTAATYGNPKYSPIDEEHPQEPINPYGASKLTVEKIMDKYDKSYGLRSVRLRYFNVAGADSNGIVGEWHDPETHVIPNTLKATDDNPFRIMGTDYDTPDGTCVRDYINVEDLIAAHLLAKKYLDNGGRTDFFNLGTSTGNSVKDVYNTCCEVTGRKIPCIKTKRREGDPPVLVADYGKAKRVLGWQPQKDLRYSVQTADAWRRKQEAIASK